ncbi:hypothetical protein GALL_161930 [mine drainage metagenome]|uniref:Uncharacterized protein n=1 Tax=mine drainage metagenome TaxID=410659 RepID=A0A1J5S125_9ZZZZ
MSTYSAAPGTTLAALAAVLALTLPARQVLASNLGRLFFTPEQRRQLDRQRNGEQRPRADSETLFIDGVVRRSDGATTVWVNGVAQHEGLPGIRIFPSAQDPSRVTLRIEGGAPVRLRVGEAIKRTTREKDDGLAGGSIHIHGGKR